MKKANSEFLEEAKEVIRKIQEKLDKGVVLKDEDRKDFKEISSQLKDFDPLYLANSEVKKAVVEYTKTLKQIDLHLIAAEKKSRPSPFSKRERDTGPKNEIKISRSAQSGSDETDSEGGGKKAGRNW